MIKAPGQQLKRTVYELISGCDPAVIIKNDCGVFCDYRSASGSRKKRRYRCVWYRYIITQLQLATLFMTECLKALCCKWVVFLVQRVCNVTVISAYLLLFVQKDNPYGWVVHWVPFFLHALMCSASLSHVLACVSGRAARRTNTKTRTNRKRGETPY